VSGAARAEYDRRVSGAALRFIDETPSGTPLRTVEVPLRVVGETVAVRDLIALRIDHARAATGSLDASAELAAACADFERGGFLLLVGDEQVESLDTIVELVPGLELRFVELVPLVGG
jgi:hypothetical protein